MLSVSPTEMPVQASSYGPIYLASDLASSATSDVGSIAKEWLDVDRDDSVSALDLLLVIEGLNRTSENTASSVLPEQSTLDVNGDFFVSALDALLIVNELNAPPADDAPHQPPAGTVASAGVQSTLVAGTLQIDGTEFPDLIEVRQYGMQIWVSHSTRFDGQLLASGTARFDAPLVSAISVNGGLGDDTIRITFPATLNRFAVTVDGGSGDDVLEGVQTNVTMIGGPGNDRMSGRSGTITLDYRSSPSGIDVSLLENTTAKDGFGSTDAIFGITNVFGSAHDDALQGNRGFNTLLGFAGRDVLNGEDGDDAIDGGDGNDVIVGGRGNDFLNGQAGDDAINGGEGNDQLRGELGNDLLEGDDGDDAISAGEGNDRLLGGVGADSMFGDSGNDILTPGPGNDLVDGGAGTGDEVDYADAITGANLEDRFGVTINLVTGQATGEGTDTLLRIEYANGSEARDTIIATSSNKITGNAGDDTFIIDGMTVALGTLDPRDDAAMKAFFAANAEVLDLFDETWDEFRTAFISDRMAADAATRSMLDEALLRMFAEHAKTPTAGTYLTDADGGFGLGGPFGTDNTPFDPDTWEDTAGGATSGINDFVSDGSPFDNMLQTKWAAVASGFGDSLATFGKQSLQTVGNAFRDFSEGIGDAGTDFCVRMQEAFDTPNAWVGFVRCIGALGMLVRDVIATVAETAVTIVLDSLGNILGALVGRALKSDEVALATDVFSGQLNTDRIKIVDDGVVSDFLTNALGGGAKGIVGGYTIFMNPPDAPYITVVNDRSYIVDPGNRSSLTGSVDIATFVHELTHVYQKQRERSTTARAQFAQIRKVFENPTIDNRSPQNIFDVPPTADEEPYRVNIGPGTEWLDLGIEAQAAAVETLFSFLELTSTLEKGVASLPADDFVDGGVLLSTSEPQSVAVGSLDSAGYLYAVVASPDNNLLTIKKHVQVDLEATGATLATISTSFQPRSVAIGDVDGDAKSDLITLNTDDTVSVFFGDGSGLSFDSPRTKEVKPMAGLSSLAVRDLDGNGRDDIVVTGRNSGEIYIVESETSRELANPVTVGVGGGPTSVALEPFFAYVRLFDMGTSTSAVGVHHRQVTSGTIYNAAQSTSYGWEAGSSVTESDTVGADDVARDFNSTSDGTFSLRVAPGQYSVFITYSADSMLGVNNDQGRVSLSANGITASITDQKYDYSASSAVHPGELFNVNVEASDDASEQEIQIKIAGKTGVDFSRPMQVNIHEIRIVSENVDIAVLDKARGEMTLLLRDIQGNYVKSTTVTVGTNPVAMDIGSLPGSSLAIITADQGSNSLSILSRSRPRAEGVINFATTTLALPHSPSTVSVGYFDEDSKTPSTSKVLDLVVGFPNAAEVAVYTHVNVATQSLGTPIILKADAGFTALTTGDWDNNGADDIVVMNPTSGNSSLWLNTMSNLAKRAYAILQIDPRTLPATIGDVSTIDAVFSNPINYAEKFKGVPQKLAGAVLYPGWSGYFRILGAGSRNATAFNMLGRSFLAPWGVHTKIQ